MKKFLLFSVLVVILVSALLISACGGNSSSTSTKISTTTTSTTPAGTTTTSQTPTSAQPKSGGTFTFLADRSPGGNIGWPPKTFTMVPQYMLYNSLVKAWWDQTITPELATSWDVDAAAPSVTFHLRKGVKFHDGTDFNAQAVKFNFDPLIAAKSRTWKSVEVVDDYTVRVNLAAWDNTVLQSFDGTTVVSPTAAAKGTDYDYIQLHPVGTGPFTFVEYVQDDHMTLKKNPNYWDQGLPYVDTYVIKYVPEYSTRKSAMEIKQGDMMLVELGKEAADFKNNKDINLFVQPQATTFMVMDDLNQDSPFYKKEVREAVDYAIDRQWLADNLGGGFAHPCYQLPPPNNTSYDPAYVGRQFSLDKAKALLTQAGYPAGFKTSLYPNPIALNKDIWVAVSSQLAKVGITAELQFLEPGKFDEYRNTGSWKNAIIGDTLPSYGNMNQSLLQDFGPNAFFFQSLNKQRPDWVSAITAATTPVNYDNALTQKAAKVLYDNVTVVPFMEAGRGYIYQKYVMDPGVGKRSAYFWAWDWEHFWLNK
jgi:peptide/nickel transport system substrate-binding protein